MLSRLEASHDHVIGYAVGGDVTEAESEQAAGELLDVIDRHGKARVLFRLTGLSLEEFIPVLRDNLGFLREHAADIERVAVVRADEPPSMWMTRVTEAIERIQVRHFTPDQEGRAWTWLD